MALSIPLHLTVYGRSVNEGPNHGALDVVYVEYLTSMLQTPDHICILKSGVHFEVFGSHAKLVSEITGLPIKVFRGYNKVEWSIRENVFSTLLSLHKPITLFTPCQVCSVHVSKHGYSCSCCS